MFKFPTQKKLKGFPHKKIAGKNVFFMSKKNLPSMKLIKNIYEKIGDDKRIPLVFETKKQYVRDYIKNQEFKRKHDFPKWQEQEYKHQELANMSGVVSRYTTKKNKYIEPRVVVFTDNKLSPKQLKLSLVHEYAHEKFERDGKKYSRPMEEIKAERYAENRLQNDLKSKDMKLFHGTSQQNWQNIQQQGLRPNTFLSPQYNYGRLRARQHGDGTILSVDVDVNKLQQSGRHYVTQAGIPPEKVEFVENTMSRDGESKQRKVSNCCRTNIYRGTDNKQYCSNCNLEVLRGIRVDEESKNGGKYFRETYLPQQKVYFKPDVTPREKKIISRQIAKHPEWLGLKGGEHKRLFVDTTNQNNMEAFGVVTGSGQSFYEKKDGRIAEEPIKKYPVRSMVLGKELFTQKYDPRFVEYYENQVKPFGTIEGTADKEIAKGKYMAKMNIGRTTGHEFKHLEQMKEHPSIRHFMKEYKKNPEKYEEEAKEYGFATIVKNKPEPYEYIPDEILEEPQEDDESKNMVKEYAIWGTKNGNEDIVRVNGQETQKSFSKAKEIKDILEKRGDLDNIRIQTIDLDNWNMKSDFIESIGKGKENLEKDNENKNINQQINNDNNSKNFVPPKWRCPRCNLPLGYVPKNSVCPNPWCVKDPRKVNIDEESKNYIRLAKNYKQYPDYAMGVNQSNNKDILIGNFSKADKIPIKTVSDIVAHEELHRTLSNVGGEKASRGLDYLQRPLVLRNNKVLNPNSVRVIMTRKKFNEGFKNYAQEKGINTNYTLNNQKKFDNVIEEYDKQILEDDNSQNRNIEPTEAQIQDSNTRKFMEEPTPVSSPMCSCNRAPVEYFLDNEYICKYCLWDKGYK